MIKYRNALNQEIILTRGDIKVLDWEGISGLSNIVNRNRGVNQHGYTYANMYADEREIDLTLRIIANVDNYRMIKDELYKAFNTQLTGELIVSNEKETKTIDVRITEAPRFFKSGNKKHCTISLIALDPFFKSILLNEEIITWHGGFSFKTSFPLKFKQKGETKKNIYNDGHVDTPIKIYFEGVAVNPSIINRTTGEFIKINKTIKAGETLIINTEFGNKTVEIESGGIRVNAFHYIDLDSSFFNLVTGDNLIEYTTDNINEAQKVEIRYKERYIGI